MIIAHDGRYRSQEAHCCGNQSLGYSGSYDGEVGRALGAYVPERGHYAPYGAEKTYERGGGAGGGKKAHGVLERRRLDVGGLFDYSLEPVEVFPLVAGG